MDGVCRRRDPRPAGSGSRAAGRQAAVASSVPIGAGLSSSAALTVATARMLVGLTGRRLSLAALADIAYRAEHDEVGVRCGRMDQIGPPGQARSRDAPRDGQWCDHPRALP